MVVTEDVRRNAEQPGTGVVVAAVEPGPGPERGCKRLRDEVLDVVSCGPTRNEPVHHPRVTVEEEREGRRVAPRGHHRVGVGQSTPGASHRITIARRA